MATPKRYSHPRKERDKTLKASASDEFHLYLATNAFRINLTTCFPRTTARSRILQVLEDEQTWLKRRYEKPSFEEPKDKMLLVLEESTNKIEDLVEKDCRKILNLGSERKRPREEFVDDNLKHFLENDFDLKHFLENDLLKEDNLKILKGTFSRRFQLGYSENVSKIIQRKDSTRSFYPKSKLSKMFSFSQLCRKQLQEGGNEF